MKIIRYIKGLVLCTAFCLLLAGCVGASPALLPVTTSGVVIANLTWVVFGVAAVVFVVVETLLVISIIKHRQKKGENTLLQKDLPEQVEGNQFFETAWTIAPAIVLAIIFGLTLIALQAIVNPPAGQLPAGASAANVVNVKVTGHQWWWQFDYPDLKITTADEIHVPVDSVVMVTVESADVIHSFWVPQFGGKIDVIPGHTNSTWFKATQTGIFKGQCSEYCGEEHAEMAFNVVVDTAESYQTWVKQQQSLPAAMTGEAEEGQQLFMKRACAGCHTVQGSPAKGKVGPDLTHLASRSIFSGGVMKNTPENLKLWIANPPAVKPGVKMPNLGISPQDINMIVTYLDALK